ncbi:Folate receptor [Paragonimus heterotremus]|uniref:Folate receptor n=1 Tax=Paragonimus heterotremus TaxID=100268 RepID=A0A8J4WW66_9TREM|nr:Folate receptor [Paragonimus heterotremus]
MKSLRTLVVTLTLFMQTILCSTDNRLNYVRTVDEYISTCPKTLPNETTPKPQPEDKICSDWSQLSCCSPETEEQIRQQVLHSFDLSHCKPISKKCAQFFLRDLCHYECSPHMGPWLVKTSRKIGLERAFGVPLCVDDCNAWWDACKTDQTCVRDWSVEFEWHSGQNTCPSEKECKTFSSIYKNSTDFCESIWDGSWRVEPSDQCFHFSSNAAPFHEHNRRVSAMRAKEILRRLTAGTARAEIQALRSWLVCAAIIVVSHSGY